MLLPVFNLALFTKTNNRPEKSAETITSPGEEFDEFFFVILVFSGDSKAELFGSFRPEILSIWAKINSGFGAKATEVTTSR